MLYEQLHKRVGVMTGYAGNHEKGQLTCLGEGGEDEGFREKIRLSVQYSSELTSRKICLE